MTIHRSKCHLSFVPPLNEPTQRGGGVNPFAKPCPSMSTSEKAQPHNHTHALSLSHSHPHRLRAACVHGTFCSLLLSRTLRLGLQRGRTEQTKKKWGRGGAGKSCNKVFIPFVHSHNFRGAVAAHRQKKGTPRFVFYACDHLRSGLVLRDPLQLGSL